MTFSKTLLAGAAALFLSVPFTFANDSNHSGHDAASHGEHKHQTLEVTAAWTRATVKTAKVGGGFISIKNNGDHADRLIGGTAGFAGDVQLHTMAIVDDVARMRPLPDGIEIPAGGEVILKPGGDHVMFMGLKEQLKEGEKRSVSLTFEKAGKVEVTFKVNGLAAKGAGEDHSGHGHTTKEKTSHGDHSEHSH
ncbi:MAG: copper chaperone PCu(A)C [Hyphomicrobiales bacterium]